MMHLASRSFMSCIDTVLIGLMLRLEYTNESDAEYTTFTGTLPCPLTSTLIIQQIN